MMMLAQKYVRRQTREAFTVIEIAIVLGLIGLLLIFLLPNIGRVTGQARRTATDSKLKEVQAAITQYQLNTLKWPTRLSDLINKPADPKLAVKWRGPYLDDEPVDGWGNPLRYDPTGKFGKPYQLYSFGPNGPGSSEDEHISVWNI